ncbi:MULTISPECIES: ABC transporter permease [unclassified Beijerinckia]|uniref:ABC transporter permease n=1 Tax=unclassified Beijerinckia TaxID=2638183 RepID=UPI00089A54B7|nr:MULTISPECIES: ABC transporter permease [unclassified Beijerinckia]MDH7798753.1 NitT/TauT family transport system permease protein [Beijerinckia sp. GAS462]SED31946.1 NitT/TauT family transport system permease protein [Beijerinckia sp. 28-YEA-48]
MQSEAVATLLAEAPPIKSTPKSPSATDGMLEGDFARDAAIVAAAVRRRRLMRLLPWLVIVAMLLLWEIGVRVFDVPEFVLPAPSVVAQSIVKWWSPIVSNALQTLKTTLIGFAMANVLGLALGVLVGSSTMVYHGLYPLLIAFNSIPKVALVPLLVIWCGIGTLPAVLTSFLISFFPITVNVAAGIATVEPELRDVLRALGARPLKIVRKVGLPRSMPYYFASLKIAITSSFLGSILAETIAGQSGIGHLMIVASSRFDVPLVFAGVVVTAAMSVTMYTIATLIETRTISWATRSQGDQSATGV